jgi:hypothetical protein
MSDCATSKTAKLPGRSQASSAAARSTSRAVNSAATSAAADAKAATSKQTVAQQTTKTTATVTAATSTTSSVGQRPGLKLDAQAGRVAASAAGRNNTPQTPQTTRLPVRGGIASSSSRK